MRIYSVQNVKDELHCDIMTNLIVHHKLTGLANVVPLGIVIVPPDKVLCTPLLKKTLEAHNHGVLFPLT